MQGLFFHHGATTWLWLLLTVSGLIKERAAFLVDLNCTPLRSKLRQTSFDFASPSEWDKFYEGKQGEDGDVMSSSDDCSSVKESTATEWHSSIPLDDIASTILPHERCLVVGCGDSKLPDTILLQENPPMSLVMLDTSEICLHQLKKRLTSKGIDVSQNGDGEKPPPACRTEIDFVCGDATKLSAYFKEDSGDHEDESDARNKGHMMAKNGCFDIIVDKGLTDAVLCGEGWDGPLERLLCESSKVLSADTGRYLLISYQLPSSTKEFLLTVGRKFGLEWKFDYVLSPSEPSEQSRSQRVSVAMAMKRKKDLSSIE